MKLNEWIIEQPIIERMNEGLDDQIRKQLNGWTNELKTEWPKNNVTIE